MLTKIHIIITTYERPELLDLLLSDIAREKEKYHIEIFVYNDCSSREYFLDERGLQLHYYRSPIHHGKAKYYKLVSKCFEDTGRSDADFFIMLPDDVRLASGFFKKAIKTWEIINDEKKISLNLLLDKAREGKKCWTGFQPIKVVFGNIEVWHTQWNDLCFISTWKFFSAMKYKVNFSTHWNPRDPARGSGVGKVISESLDKVYNLYQVTTSLAGHGNHYSVMNEASRRVTPMIAEIT